MAVQRVFTESVRSQRVEDLLPRVKYSGADTVSAYDVH